MRALIFDLDDTLLDSEKRIGDVTRQALFAAHDAGFRIILATSRPIRTIRHFLDDNILSVCVSVSLNGAVVHEEPRTDASQMFGNLGANTAPLVERLEALEQELYFSVEFEGTHFATNRNHSDEELRDYHSATRDMVVALDRSDPHTASKIAVDGLGSRVDDCLAMSTDHPDLRFIPAMDHTFVNIVPGAVDKSTTLKRLAPQIGIDLAQSYAFGDDLPDIEMFGVVGTAVAMSNAKEQVKQAADVIIGHCDADAIGQYLTEHVLR